MKTGYLLTEIVEGEGGTRPLTRIGHRGAARFGGGFGLFTPIFQYLGNLLDSAIASIEGQFAAS
jgi:hypothetical protein